MCSPSETNGGVTCNCQSGFVGSDCGTEHPCLSVTCQNDGVCSLDNTGIAAKCTCTGGYGYCFLTFAFLSNKIALYGDNARLYCPTGLVCNMLYVYNITLVARQWIHTVIDCGLCIDHLLEEHQLAILMSIPLQVNL